jgi:acyl-CoA thioester hydrolase
MHTFPTRVFYEDTDMGGIVYYANYLKFIERARSDWVKALGIDQNALREAGTVFAVRRVEADWLAPARLDDELEVRTTPVSATGARVQLDQDVWRGEQRLFAARVTLVAMGPDGRPARIPSALRAAIGERGQPRESFPSG